MPGFSLLSLLHMYGEVGDILLSLPHKGCFFFFNYLLFCVCSCHYVFFLSCEQACADKLKREISEYGLPPQFPAVEEEEESTSETPVPSTAPVDKSKGKKVKQKDSY